MSRSPAARAVARPPASSLLAAAIAFALIPALALLLAEGGGGQPQAATPPPDTQPAPQGGEPAIRWRASRAIGRTNAGRLVRGVQLPAESALHFTWDPIWMRSPNRAWRLYGTDGLVLTLIRVLNEYRTQHPGAPRVGIGDLSRPHGGDFGPRFGGLGHASHQNGLDVDVFYPRLDRLERGPLSPPQIDRALAQDLADGFVRAGARFVFVGYHTGLRGPSRVVQSIPFHDDHMHVRITRSLALARAGH